MSDRVLILGGAGFVGSSLAIALQQRHPDWRICCLDNLRRRGSELNLPRLQALGIAFSHGDIRQASDLEPAAFPVDTILDCSAEPSVLAGFSSPQYVLHTNLLGTINALELARQVGARFLFLSTSRVYPIASLKAIALQEAVTRWAIAPEQTLPGVSPAGVAETFPLNGYRSLYGATKLASELLIEEYHQAYGLPTLVNRCGVLTGPWQMGKVDQGVFALWVAAHRFQTPLRYIGYGGTGKQVRDLLHIADLIELVEGQLAQFADLNGQVFNVGGGAAHSLSLLETTQLCQQLTGQTIPIQAIAEERPGDVPWFITDARRVQQATGWQPQRSPAQTLEDIDRWLQDNRTLLEPIFT